MMATVVLNLSGLMTGLLQLFLRSNTSTTSFGPKLGRSWEQNKHEIKIFGPNELAFQMHLADPVSGPRSPADDMSYRNSSSTNLIELEKGKGRGYSMESITTPTAARSPTRYNPLTSNAVTQIRPMQRLPSPEPVAQSPKRTHTRKQSYSLFPNGQPSEEPPSPTKLTIGNLRQQQDPTSIYDISELGDLEPPPSMFGKSGKYGHARNSSMISSATVQIGLRLSHAISPCDEDMMALPLPSTTYNANAAKRPESPLRVQTQTTANQPPIPIPMKSPRRPSPLNTNLRSPTNLSPVRATCINKTLPPTPAAPGFIPQFQRLAGSTTQLSPAVYQPEKKVPKIVGMPQSATIPKRSPFNDSVTAPQRSNSNRQPLTEAKGEWI